MAKIGKRYKAAAANVESEKLYALSDAAAILKNNAKSKFDETVDVAMKLGVDPKHADQMVRGTLILPNGTGKDVKVIVFAKGPKAEEAKKAGADIVGDDELVDKVGGGFVDFDCCIATPDMMAKVGRLGKVLGPKGLMPNPKLGTVTMDLAKAVKDAKGGRIEFKVEKAGIVQAGVGKASFDAKKIAQNVAAFVAAVNHAKPSGSKGVYIQSISISSTMGPGLKLDVADVLAADAA